MKALFVGRFQPFHKGHLYAIKQAMKKFDKITIGIASAQFKDTLNNPFSHEERKKMIEACLKGYEDKYEIILIPDFGDDKTWADYCLKKADFDVVITGNEWTKRCFEGIKKVIEPDFLEPEKYSATNIREKILKNERWEDLVPKEVVKIIKSINGEERIRKIYAEIKKTYDQ
jgi:nicotinamide-nucleotide adenylyltransferase